MPTRYALQSRFRSVVFFIVAGFAVLALLGLSGCNDHAGSDRVPAQSVDDIDRLWPPVRARPTTLEFGEVLLNEPVTKNITLVNLGETDATLVNSRTNCGCTTTDVTGMVVPANGSLDLPIHFDAEGRDGNRSATVTLFFDGWPNPITFNIRAVVVRQ